MHEHTLDQVKFKLIFSNFLSKYYYSFDFPKDSPLSNTRYTYFDIEYVQFMRLLL